MEIAAEFYQPLSHSQKIYIEGQRYPELRVPLREIQLTGERTFCVYDTSGPYTDTNISSDIGVGLSPIRRDWDHHSAEYPSRHAFTQHSDTQKLQRTPRKAKEGLGVTQLYYAKRGIITPEMEFVALRENQRVANWLTLLKNEEREHRLRGSNREIPLRITAEFVRDEIAAGRAIIPANINHPELEPMIIGRKFLTKINANIGNSALSSSIS